MTQLFLQGKIALVTGGGSGLGREIVRGLAAAGADVAFSYHQSRAGAESLAKTLEETGRRIFVSHVDARQRGSIETFVREASRALGGLDVLVNNVGVFRRTKFDELEDDVLDEAFDVNVRAALSASRAAAEALRRRPGGSIVNVASLGGLRPWPNHIAYCVSKAALVMATQCLAVALAPDIRVNAVAPGVLDPPGASETVRDKIPLRRFGTYEETVQAVLFLASPASAYTTGEILRLDGGRSLV